MSAKKRKVGPQDSFPIKQLFDEILEEVFTHLKPKEQLSCRQVCHLWNDLLCRDTRLLKTSVGIHLEIDDQSQVGVEHPLTSVLKQNPAFKVRKVSLDAELFISNNGETAKINELENFFAQFGEKDLVTELQISYRNYQNLSFFKILFSMLEIFSKVKILRLNVDEMDPLGGLIVFPEKWNECQFKCVEELHFEYFSWNIRLFENYMNFCKKLPSLKIISGVDGYNEPFYRKYSNIIKFAYLNYSELDSLIAGNTGIQLKGAHITGYDNHNTTDAIWNFLNNDQKDLTDISLTFDDPFHLEDNLMRPFAVANYDKVRLLQVHAPVNDEQAHRFQQDLLMFKNLKKLFVSFSNFGHCFFGHTVTSLSSLEAVDYVTYSRRDAVTCAICFDTLLKSVMSVKTLSLCMPVTTQDIKLIVDTIPHLEILKLLKLSPNSVDIFASWPRMPDLLELLIQVKPDLRDPRIVSHLCEACPNLKNIRLFESDNFTNDLLNIFVENLKNLEKIQFDNGTFVTKEENGETRLVKK